MRILYQSRPKEAWQGGDMIQLDNTMNEIKKLGHTVEFNDQPLITPALKLRLFDLVHTFSFCLPWTKYQIWAAKNAGKKVVCSMLYGEWNQFTPYEEQQVMADSLDACIFLSEGERDRALEFLNIDEKKIHIIPNGLDPFWKKKLLKPELDPYILTVGRIEPNKNQALVAEVCERKELKYVCVGEIVDEGYANELSKFQNTVLIKPTEDKMELKKWYSGAKALVLMSHVECYPLTVMEALSVGTPVILSKGSAWQPKEATIVEPNDSRGLENALDIVFFKPTPDVQFPTWKQIAKKVNIVYEGC